MQAATTQELVNRSLRSLTIQNFRNIESASLMFSDGMNFFHGKNGSGKTSLLEAIYCLGRVRSFRTHQADQPIQYNQAAYRLVGKIAGQGSQLVPLGIERSASSLTVHFNAKPVRRLSELAGNFPVQILSGDTANILNGGPRYRRQVLDWALFHVEPAYRESWQQYSRSLRQRNAALRSHSSPALIRIWDEELIAAANELDRMRRNYLDELAPLLLSELDILLPNTRPSLRYLPGWPANTTLADSLHASLERDRAQGFTAQGVHRADFRLTVNDHDIAGHCSRGQQKSLLVAFMLAQVLLQRARNAPPGSFLLDDLASELDSAAQHRVLQGLHELGAQIFITQIDSRIEPGSWRDAREFHVEHGHIKEVV